MSIYLTWPVIAAREWETRKLRIAKDAEMLSKRRADQHTLDQKIVIARVKDQISADDFDTARNAISAEIQQNR
jgi:hypothetical protein